MGRVHDKSSIVVEGLVVEGLVVEGLFVEISLFEELAPLVDILANPQCILSSDLCVSR